MNPKKFKDIVSDIVQETDYDKQLVTEVLDFYWSNVRKAISTVAHPRVNIEGLGVFRVKPRVLDKTIDTYKITMAGFKSPNFQAYPRYQALKERLEALQRAAEILESEYQRLQQIKTDKNGNIPRGLEEKG